MSIKQDFSSIINGVSVDDVSTLYFLPSVILLLLVIYVLINTYKATKNVEKKLAEFSSFTGHAFAGNLQLVEIHANEHKLNKKALGPLARIIDEYAVTVTDGNGFVTYANEKFLAISGFSAGDLIAKARIINDSACHDNVFWKEMWSTISSEKVWHGEIGNRNRSGGIYWIDTFIFPLSYISKESDGYICFGTDITAIKQQNTRLKNEVAIKDKVITKVENMLLHSEKMASLGTISAGIAHEINNPVAFVASNIRRLNEYLDQLVGVVRDQHPALDEDMRDVALILEDYPSLIKETNDGIDRIRKIITDLKCFSHEQKEDFALLDIHKCIETSLNLVRSELKYKIRIQKIYGESLPPVNGSETQLSQVFVNIFVNAAHAIEKDGEIRIVTHVDNNHLAISIADNGKGIEPDVLKDIFEPFFTTKPVGQGTGLGLSISHDIIKCHGGEILVHSVIGSGTTFTIKLPLSVAEVERANCAA